MDLKIRPFDPCDLGRIFEIYQLCRQSECFKTKSAANLTEFSELLYDEDTFVIIIEGVVSGFISIYAPQSFIHHLYILPECQGLGLGQKLLKYVISDYDAPFSLKCESGNLPAINFYKKNGWEYFDNGIDIEGIEYYLLTYGVE